MEHNPQCFANHLGPWLVEPQWFSAAMASVKSGAWKPVGRRALNPMAGTKVVMDPTSNPDNPDVLYVASEGVGIIDICGPMMKFDSKFGGANTIRTRRALRAASIDPDVKAIVLNVDTPGGSVAGTSELASEITATDAKKPVYAAVSDMCASAGLWVASQARRVTANATAMVGSIGVFSVIEDSSKAAELAGIKVHVIGSGGVKGGGVDGAPVTQDVLDEAQKLIDGTNVFFIKAIADGRKMALKDVKALNDGRCFLAAEAQKLGLIDEVAGAEDVISGLAAKIGKETRRQARADLGRSIIKAQL